MRAVAEKPRDAVVKFDTYRHVHAVQRHRAVLPAIARLLFSRLLYAYSSLATLSYNLDP